MDHLEIANCRMVRHDKTSLYFEEERIPQSNLLGNSSTASSTPENTKPTGPTLHSALRAQWSDLFY